MKSKAQIMALLIMMLIMTRAVNGNLVDPLSIVNTSAPLPIGITSYGLYNIPNDSGPYTLHTDELLGYAKIYSATAYNATPPVNASQYGMTVQLNGVMNITADNGINYTYWTQDVVDLNTSNMTFSIGDNVWNMTGTLANVTNATITGNGEFAGSPVPITNTTTYNATFYTYFTNATYITTSPLYLIPIMKVSIHGGYPLMQFGFMQGNSIMFYDNVTFNIPARSAEFIVNPYHLTKSSPGLNSTNFYDSELILGGEDSGETSVFSNTNATLWMGYVSNGTIKAFPAVADFGADTGESAVNLAVNQYGNYSNVHTGTLNYNKTITLSGVPDLAASSFILQNVTSTASASIPGISALIMSYGNEILYAIIGLIVLLVIVILYLMFAGRRNGQARQQ